MPDIVYDKAKWHWGAKDAPTDIPHENGATHIAFFFRWCMEHKFYSKEFAADFADDIAQMDENFNYRQYLFDAMDGVLGSAELNTAGKPLQKLTIRPIGQNLPKCMVGICRIIRILFRKNLVKNTLITPIFI
ncbi:DUF7832 domain-containing protein [Campylobacter concisus]|uniref:DUF7832 domain-containing protein n=1 Tax=Campylobacter concisus TaxID=199 RepID=UPI0021564F1D|nr:hypothetical protein [Campylobacter concisus]